MMNRTLNDSLDDLLSGPVADTPRQPAPELNYQPNDFTEPCPKCRGTGRFTGWSGRSFGQCFACKGAGKKVFRTSKSERRAKMEREHAHKAKVAAEAWHAFVEAKPEIALWIETERARFDFAQKMREAVEKYGELTEGQEAAIVRLIENAKAKTAAQAARHAAAPVADTAGIDRLKAAFDTAAANGAKRARITIGGVVISPAKAESKNAGSLYVKERGTYLGKITGGRFLASRECRPEQEKRVLAFVADPQAAAIAYGLETGVCCICNTTLTNKASIARGIGPICASKFGW